MAPVWRNSNKTYIWLFNVGRGLSVCVRLPNNIGIIYDLGSSDLFSPLSFIKTNIVPHLAKYNSTHNMGQVLVSHPHQDHTLEAKKLNESNGLKIGLITMPHTKEVEGQEDEKLDLSRIENKDNKESIEEYKKLYEGRTPPLQSLKPGLCQPINQDLEYGIYYMRPPEVAKFYPKDDHKYGNGVSICFYLRHNNHSIWICGDVVEDVHEEILTGEDSVEKRFTYFNPLKSYPDDYQIRTSSQPTPQQLFAAHGLTILVAPHHGLESCFCEALFNCIAGGHW
jgi:hypothetical protein